ncbi:MAG: HEAT repeat domain-containing protein [Planctomycetes bacterium]|nr:HEAT repeat domain-containing protein [Planctomycetota bacterium]
MAPDVDLLLRAVLAADTPAATAAALRALAEAGPSARDAATPTLVKLLSGARDPAVRAAAADALQRVGAAAPDAVLRLARAHGDPAREVRLRAALALRALPPAAVVPAVPALVRLAGDRRDDVLDEVVRALVHVGRAHASDVAAALAAARRGRGRRTRAVAARVLAAIGGPAAVADVEEAPAWLADGDPWLRACGADVLARQALTPTARVDRVLAALAGARREVAARAGEVRSSLPLDPAALRARVDRGPARERALALLLLVGPGAPPPGGALDGLRRRLVRRGTCVGAADALVDLARRGVCTAGEAAAVVCEGLWARDPEVQAAAARALEALPRP